MRDEEPVGGTGNDDSVAAVEALRNQLQRVRHERDAARRRAEEAEQRLEAVYATPTWRIGRTIMRPVRLARALARRSARVRRLVARLRHRDAPSPAIGARAPSLAVEPDDELRSEYARALGVRAFTGAGPRLSIAVSTTDLAAGRGDLFTALGLGRALTQAGWQVVYLGPKQWYDPPDGTQVYLALLAERDLATDPLLLPGDCVRVAWVRNLTERWVASGKLPLYDGVLASSRATLRAVRRVYSGPVEQLPIGVDERLFHQMRPVAGRQLVVSTVNGFNKQRGLFATLSAVTVDFPLALYGHRNEEVPGLAPFARGPVDFFALPSVYNQAALVLDDQQASNREYGNVNSRVFESLACGALPVSNSASGLRELGLSAVPTYETPQQLSALVAEQLAPDGMREALVAELRDVVLREHTYRRRAETFDAFARGLLDGPSDTTTLLGFFPDYRSTNPYQDMLYARAADTGFTPLPVSAEPLPVAEHAAWRGRGFVYHVHWTAPVLGPAQTRRAAEQRCDRFLADLDAVRSCGGRVVWTVHNVLPHECTYPDVERRLRAGLAERADLVHVMCAETPDIVASHYELPADRTHVVPHGSYVDVYPNIVDERQARLELGLKPEHVVLLCLGGIRPYKGIGELLDAFEIVARERAEYRLVVAGRPGRFRELEALRRRCDAQPQVIPYFEPVDDVDLQVFFNAADGVVLPHKQVLNSGALQLAWSFGRPVIAPRRGCLTGQVTPDVGVTFEGHTDLVAALRQAVDLRSSSAPTAAFRRAAEYPFTAMSQEFLAQLASLRASTPQEVQ